MSDRELALPPRVVPEPTDLATYVSALAIQAGLVAERVEFYDDDLHRLFGREWPCLYIPAPGGHAAVLIGRSTARSAEVVTRDGGSATVPAAKVLEVLRAGAVQRVATLSGALGLTTEGASDAKRLSTALYEELAENTPVGWGFVFRPNVAESVPSLVRSLKLGRYGGGLLGYALIQSLLTTAAWGLIGSLTLSGHTQRGSLLGWGLLSLTATLVQVVSTRYVGRFTLRAATVLRQRLLEGALRIEIDALSAFGLGGMTVIAAQADAFVNSVIALFLALLGALTNAVAAIAVLGISPLPALMIATLLAFVATIFALTPRVASLAARMQVERTRLTTEMVERMVGHRTRLVQQTPDSWHDGEDESVHDYARRARRFDRTLVFLRAVPRAYNAVSLVALFFVLVASPTQEALALTVGGVTLGMATLSALTEVVISGAELYGLGKAISPVVRETGALSPLTTPGDIDERDDTTIPVVELRAVRFAYTDRSRPVFDDARLTIRSGERVLIEGPSGGGKTTLAALLAGLRRPQGGLLLVKGLDQHTIGDFALRQVVASAPQFYKNHIFSGSLAFNVLLGRAWPPATEDLRAATRVLHAVGLGPLLGRMPAGLEQHVGETGWQLSHGERSRVYLARTLLQRAELVMLDETLGALDPASLRTCMEAVLEAANTLVVITHR